VLALRSALAVLVATLLACGSDEPSIPTQTTFGGDRPVELLVPEDYDHSQPLPLILILHGYSAAGSIELAYSRLGNLVDDPGVFVMAPDGLVDDERNRYWKSEHEGCELHAEGPDDVAYLMGLLDEVASVYQVDPDRTFIFGHSNGGFMAYRLACTHSERFAAIISLAGSAPFDPSDCVPTEAVSVLQIHGDADDTVPYEGGTEVIGIPCMHPSAPEMVETWGEHVGCTGELLDTGEDLDIEDPLDDPETRVEAVAGCPAGVGVELWTIEGGGHIPRIEPPPISEQWWAAVEGFLDL